MKIKTFWEWFILWSNYETKAFLIVGVVNEEAHCFCCRIFSVQHPLLFPATFCVAHYHCSFSNSLFPLCRMCQLTGEDKMTSKTSEPLPLYSPTVEDGMELGGWQQIRGTIEKLTQLIRIFWTHFSCYPLQSAMYLAVCKFGCNPWTK